jgi:hypothetical protein
MRVVRRGKARPKPNLTLGLESDLVEMRAEARAYGLSVSKLVDALWVDYKRRGSVLDIGSCLR